MGSLLLFGIACGGKVVVESSGATGAGGASSTSTTSSIGNGGSTGDVSPVGAVSSSSGGPSLCQQFCANETANGCEQGLDCLTHCQQSYANAVKCTPQIDGLIQCLVTTGETTCMMTVQCQAQVQAYASCVSTQMCNGPTSCGGTSDGTCDCTTDCNGSKLEVQCTPGNAADSCTCIKDGMPIDKCGQPQGTGLSCNIEQGCCAKSFFGKNSP